MYHKDFTYHSCPHHNHRRLHWGNHDNCHQRRERLVLLFFHSCTRAVVGRNRDINGFGASPKSKGSVVLWWWWWPLPPLLVLVVLLVRGREKSREGEKSREREVERKVKREKSRDKKVKREKSKRD